ncbi:MAG: hypothetical protein O3B13_11705 [Planctomycetota bacterium]|nr:hypothetical protein [Planctomycetota bacterium]
MKSTATTLVHGLIFGLAVILTGTAAQAGHYGHIDDHSRDIEREAERAEAIVKYNFRHAPSPIFQYLCVGLGEVSQTAHQLHELSECSGNVLAIEAVTARLDAQFCEVQEGISALREWVTGCQCSVRRFSSSFALCHPRSVDRANFASLARRIDEIDGELREMKQDLQIVMVEYHRAHHHSAHGHVSSFGRPAPAPVLSRTQIDTHRQVLPLGSLGKPGHDFSDGRNDSRGHSSFHGSPGFTIGSNSSPYSRHRDNTYIQTRIGGFGLSLRLR